MESFLRCLAAAFCAFEPVLYRYQTLLVGVVALWIAFTQMSIVKEQHKMARDQRATEKAIATIGVDKLLEQTRSVLYEIQNIAAGVNAKNSGGQWQNEILTRFRGQTGADSSIFEANAIKAFPEDAPALVRLAQAFNDCIQLFQEFEAAPWPSDALSIKLLSDAGKPPSVAQAQKRAQADDALTRFYDLAVETLKLHPRTRSGQAVHGG